MNTILPLTTTDLEEAYQLEIRCHPVPWSKKTFYSNQGNRYLNLKIVKQNKMVGFCICHLVVDEASLFNIAIHPDFRRQKLAQNLINQLINELTAITSPMPMTTLWLEVRKSNHAAIQLYDRLGFNEISIRKNYYPTLKGGLEDAIIMAYTLSL